MGRSTMYRWPSRACSSSTVLLTGVPRKQLGPVQQYRTTRAERPDHVAIRGGRVSPETPEARRSGVKLALDLVDLAPAVVDEIVVALHDVVELLGELGRDPLALHHLLER